MLNTIRSVAIPEALKNALDMKRLRIHSGEAMSGRIFILFIALILTTYLRSIFVEKGKSEKYDVPDILHDLEPLQRVRVDFEGFVTGF